MPGLAGARPRAGLSGFTSEFDPLTKTRGHQSGINARSRSGGDRKLCPPAIPPPGLKPISP